MSDGEERKFPYVGWAEDGQRYILRDATGYGMVWRGHRPALIERLHRDLARMLEVTREHPDAPESAGMEELIVAAIAELPPLAKEPR